MIALHLRLAWRSLWRTPVFTGVMVLVLALGISAWYVQHQVYNLVGREDLFERGDLRSVSLPRPETKRDRMFGVVPELLLTARDARAMLGSGATRRETVTFAAPAVLRVGDQPARQVRARFASRDFFAMFELPFAAGGPWSADADAGGLGSEADPREVVLDALLARALFGDEPALGRRVHVYGREMLVVGVIDEAYGEAMRVFDSRGFSERADGLYLPVAAASRAHAWPEFVLRNGRHGHRHADLFAGEDGWLMLWVELADARQEAAFRAHVTREIARDQASGRVGGPIGLVLRTPRQWREQVMTTEGSVGMWPILAGLSLAASCVNLIRLLTAKFAGRSRDLGLLRAFGARRRALVGQLLLEAGLVGLLAGLLGLALGVLMMPAAAGSITTHREIAAFSLADTGVALLLAVLAALVAALIPAWSLARGTPTAQMRRP